MTNGHPRHPLNVAHAEFLEALDRVVRQAFRGTDAERWLALERLRAVRDNLADALFQSREMEPGEEG